jgi:hypothetical protein
MKTGAHIKILDYDVLEGVIESNKLKECNNCIAQFKKEQGL